MNVKLLLLMPALLLLLSGGQISNAEPSNSFFFGDLPTIESLDNNSYDADSEEEFMCNVGGPFITLHQSFYTHCCPDNIYKLTYLGQMDTQTSWTISVTNGGTNFVYGTNKLSRVAYVRFRGCYDMNVSVRVTCSNGSTSIRRKLIKIKNGLHCCEVLFH